MQWPRSRAPDIHPTPSNRIFDRLLYYPSVIIEDFITQLYLFARRRPFQRN